MGQQLDPKNIGLLDVTKMSDNELELEQELLKVVVDIFQNAASTPRNAIEEALAQHRDRLTAIQNEIFERKVLV